MRRTPAEAVTARRHLVLGIPAAVALAACQGGEPARDEPSAEAPSAGQGGRSRSAEAATVAGWVARRRAPYYIGHRGAGTVVPEHTLESYQQALDWGADCVEISTAVTADGTLICLHDLTYDRTTTARGRVREQSDAVLDTARVDIPRLGPRWSGQARPRIPRLQDVLPEIRGRAVVCLEAKDETGFDAMLDLIAAHRMRDSVIIKLYAHSSRITSAQQAGYPVFVYADGLADLRLPGVRALRPGRDVLVLPKAIDGGPLPEPLLVAARALKVDLWAYPVVRRSEVSALRRRGFSGFVTPNLGYLSGSVPVARRDAWAQGAIEAGELTPNPYADHDQLAWHGEALRLDYPGRPSFVTLGQFCPIPQATSGYRVEVDVRFTALPSRLDSHVSIAFGHVDDTRYRHREGLTDGYHAIVRANGTMELYAHRVGVRDGQRLCAPVNTPALQAGEWVTVALTVTPSELQWSRVGQPTLTAADRRFRGGYLHVGRSGGDGPLELRRLTIHPLAS